MSTDAGAAAPSGDEMRRRIVRLKAQRDVLREQLARSERVARSAVLEAGTALRARSELLQLIEDHNDRVRGDCLLWRGPGGSCQRAAAGAERCRPCPMVDVARATR